MRDPKLYLKDILDAAEAIEGCVGRMSYEEFVSNDLVTLVASAVIRKLEIIGDDAKNVSEDVRCEGKVQICTRFKNIKVATW